MVKVLTGVRVATLAESVFDQGPWVQPVLLRRGTFTELPELDCVAVREPETKLPPFALNVTE
jgi:hypothetical protein